MTPHATEVEYIGAEEVLRVRFSDDVEQRFPVAFLRGFCPCARCQGHGAGPPTWTPWTSPRATEVVDVTPVGTYAMCIVWGDGHDTGIYSFEALRRMAPEGFDVATMTEASELPVRSG